MGTEVANYDEMLAKMAKAAAAVEKPSGTAITVRAGLLQYNGNPVAGNKLDAIIVSSVHANLYYEGKFDPNNLTSPVCFAYSPDGENMVPHPASSKPQADTCTGCPQNQWNSDPDGGRGKACKNIRSLGLVPASTKAEDAAKAEVAVLKLPVMSVKGWQTYVQECTNLYSRPTLGVITQIGTVPDPKSQFKITFENKGLLPMDVIMGLLPRMDEITETLQHVYEAPPEVTPEEQAAKDAKASKAKKF